jgi:DNA polymerase I
VHAHQVADYLALTGDAIDNIPGVPGIGAKTAAILLAHFGSLDALLERIEEIPYLRFRGAAQAAARLRVHREQALLCRQLSTIALDAPVGERAPGFERAGCDADELLALCERLRFGPLTRRRLHEAAGLAFAPA